MVIGHTMQDQKLNQLYMSYLKEVKTTIISKNNERAELAESMIMRYPHKRNKVGLRSIYCTPVLLMHNGRTQDAGPVKRFDLYGFITKLVGILLCMS